MTIKIHEFSSVLIVDDDPMTRMLVVEALEPEGFVVLEADSGLEGIEAFSRHKPDIILLDVSMPGMDGFECCRRIRRLSGGERVPVVVLTGNDDDESITSAFEAGATDFVSKPMRWKLLSYRVRYLLRSRAVLEALASSEASLAFAQQLAHVGNWEYGVATADGSWSPELYRILGLDESTDVPTHESLMLCVPDEERSPLLRSFMSLRTDGTRFGLEHRIVHRDGSERFVFHQAEATRDQGKIVSLRGTVQDITERKMHEAQIEFLANHDALTGLPNRNLLSDRIAQAIARAQRDNRRVGVMILDLDRFKFINDNFGHQVGDGLLKAVAARLRATVREVDTVARLGGDEFVIVLSSMAHPGDSEIAAQKILDAFVPPILMEGHELHVTTSIGISVFPEDGFNAEVLLKTSDAALFIAKDKGRNCFQLYTSQMGVQVEEQAELVNALTQAVVRNELEIHYQPKVDLKSGAVSGVEALLRWRRPGIGLIAPDIFIPLAELTGLIIPIGEWVLRTACIQAKAWHDAGHIGLTMAVNISARQFRLNNVQDLVRSALADSGLHAAFLELELTESVLMHDKEAAVKALQQLKEIGVVLTLDDFGTGYSSLSYLKEFPIDVIKIDKSFISDVASSVDGASLTRSIISMAESLHMITVAEGVETEEQLSFLNINRCDRMQGHYFSRPLPAGEMNALLGARTRLPWDSCRRVSPHRIPDPAEVSPVTAQ
ncbi:putative bifunctional diguanylate cyclase/phosphodiesterase [Pinirhizobacter soli]|uniref:putative bifunctional diguanylate cyclase/phosphodiesterase n=1 Tax=Pinirhizobacter soli TaxID=2786953 RepID=UPI00202A7870|nr:EAL domain-containing protein [Pinirhizobacter soli]